MKDINILIHNKRGGEVFQRALFDEGFKWSDHTLDVFHPANKYLLCLTEHFRFYYSTDENEFATLKTVKSYDEFETLIRKRYNINFKSEDQNQLKKVFTIRESTAEKCGCNAMRIDAATTGIIIFENKEYSIKRIIHFIRLYRKIKPFFNKLVKHISKIEEEEE